MADQSITCPHCGESVLLSKALTAQIEEESRKSFDKELKRKEKEMECAYQAKLEAEMQRAQEHAKEGLALELHDLRQQVVEKDEALRNAQKQELQLRKRQRELEEKERSIDLEVARKLDEACQGIEENVAKKLADEHHMKDLEKDKKLSDLTRQIEEWKRKAQQGSEQTQGEVAELELEELLRANFPDDDIEVVRVGIRGSDIVQRVRNRSGHHCGTIIWDAKNTKAWNEAWLSKLKDDQRELKAEVAVLASVALPKDVKHFAEIDGVWVTDFSAIVGIGSALRCHLIDLARVRVATDGKSSKMETLYAYLSGTEFKHRVEAIVEPFIAMQEDLQREKRAQEAAWSKREKQMQRVIQGVTGMYGDMQGIIGKEMPKIEQLELHDPGHSSEQANGLNPDVAELPLCALSQPKKSDFQAQ